MENMIPKSAIVSPNAQLEAPVRLIGQVKVRADTKIGQFTFVNEFTTIFPLSTIGRYCSIGKGCQIGAPSHPTDRLSTSPVSFSLAEHFPKADIQFNEKPFSSYKATIIGSDVWVGSNSILLAGVTVGHGAVIGGGALVNKDLEPFGIYGGVPAKLIRYRFDETTRERVLATEWWTLPANEVAKLDFTDIEGALALLEERPS